MELVQQILLVFLLICFIGIAIYVHLYRRETLKSTTYIDIPPPKKFIVFIGAIRFFSFVSIITIVIFILLSLL